VQEEQRLSHPDPGTLMVFVFDAAVIETVPWSTVVHDYLVLKRYEFKSPGSAKNELDCDIPIILN